MFGVSFAPPGAVPWRGSEGGSEDSGKWDESVAFVSQFYEIVDAPLVVPESWLPSSSYDPAA